MRIAKLFSRQGETSTSLLRKGLAAGHRRLRERLSALALIAEGLFAKAVAQRLGRHRGTVESWVQRFNRDALGALQPIFRGQPGTWLGPQELAALQEIVAHP